MKIKRKKEMKTENKKEKNKKLFTFYLKMASDENIITDEMIKVITDYGTKYLKELKKEQKGKN